MAQFRRFPQKITPDDEWRDREAATQRELVSLVAAWKRHVAVPRRRRDLVVAALAEAMVLRADPPYAARRGLLDLRGVPLVRGCLPVVKGLARDAGRHLRKTNYDDRLAPYTAGWWRGLELAGCVVRHGGPRDRLRIAPGRCWVEADLEAAPFPCHLEAPTRYGRQFSCQAARTAVADPWGLDVLLGLLCGCTRQERADGTWLALKRTPAVLRLLERWRVPYESQMRLSRIRISPFWGAALSRSMPTACGRSMAVRRAGGCPLLACAVYQVAWGSDPKSWYQMPRWSGEIPYVCNHKTRLQKGWTKGVLLKAAATGGYGALAPEVRAELELWRARDGV